MVVDHEVVVVGEAERGDVVDAERGGPGAAAVADDDLEASSDRASRRPRRACPMATARAGRRRGSRTCRPSAARPPRWRRRAAVRCCRARSRRSRRGRCRRGRRAARRGRRRAARSRGRASRAARWSGRRDARAGRTSRSRARARPGSGATAACAVWRPSRSSVAITTPPARRRRRRRGSHRRRGRSRRAVRGRDIDDDRLDAAVEVVGLSMPAVAFGRVGGERGAAVRGQREQRHRFRRRRVDERRRRPVPDQRAGAGGCLLRGARGDREHHGDAGPAQPISGRRHG